MLSINLIFKVETEHFKTYFNKDNIEDYYLEENFISLLIFS